MIYDSKPTDGGFFFLTPEEKNELLSKEAHAKKFVRRVYGAAEFINNKERYCLWLKDATPHDLRSLPMVRERVQKVREYRLKSKAKSTNKYADYPTRFKQDAQPNTNHLIVPSVSSENRRYVPVCFMSSKDIATNAVHIIPNARLYEFGIITSNVHMAWMRNEEQKNRIKSTAQGILDARSLYPESSLADLYDEVTMPVELRKAHQKMIKLLWKLTICQ